MGKLSVPHIIVIVVFVVGTTYLIYTDTINKSERAANLAERYELVTDSSNLKVRINRFFTSHCMTYITTANNEEIRFHPRTGPCEGDSYNLCLYIQVGDSILKEGGSNTLFVKRNGKSACFTIEGVK